MCGASWEFDLFLTIQTAEMTNVLAHFRGTIQGHVNIYFGEVHFLVVEAANSVINLKSQHYYIDYEILNVIIVMGEPHHVLVANGAASWPPGTGKVGQ